MNFWPHQDTDLMNMNPKHWKTRIDNVSGGGESTHL